MDDIIVALPGGAGAIVAYFIVLLFAVMQVVWHLIDSNRILKNIRYLLEEIEQKQ